MLQLMNKINASETGGAMDVGDIVDINAASSVVKVGNEESQTMTDNK